MTTVVAAPLPPASFISTVLASPAPSILWEGILTIVIASVVAGVMLLKGYDRRKTLRAIQAMPISALFVETNRLGQTTLIARGYVPHQFHDHPVHLVPADREALGK
jgi:hypothetical protein